MKKILLVSHGQMAMGTGKALTMITGIGDHVHYVCLSDESNIERFRQEVQAYIRSIKEADQILVFSDLAGGSPHVTTLTVLQENGVLDKSLVISGMNLPMILTAALHEEPYDHSSIRDLIEAGRKSIALFELIETEETL